jgi:hypothetical protein
MFGSFVFGADPSASSNGAKMPTELTADQRQKIADFHDRVATCLRSDRPMYCFFKMGQKLQD